jgi:hypothetical protein
MAVVDDRDMTDGCDGLRAHRASKLANVLFTRGLARRWGPLGRVPLRRIPRCPVIATRIRTCTSGWSSRRSPTRDGGFPDCSAGSGKAVQAAAPVIGFIGNPPAQRPSAFIEGEPYSTDSPLFSIADAHRPDQLTRDLLSRNRS